MMNAVVGIECVILGVIFALRPRSLWWLRRGLLSDRKPTRADLLFSRLAGVIVTVMGFALMLSKFL